MKRDADILHTVYVSCNRSGKSGRNNLCCMCLFESGR